MNRYEHLVELYKDKLHKTTQIGEWVTIEQDRIDEFAHATGDTQWIHTNPERAKKESPYKCTIAHGFLTLSMIPYLTMSNHQDFFKKNYPGMTLRINYGLNKVRFPNPVKVNSQIRAKMTPIFVNNLADCVEIIYEIIVEIKDEAKPACIVEQIFRLY